jgi:hypothetical protein
MGGSWFGGSTQVIRKADAVIDRRERFAQRQVHMYRPGRQAALPEAVRGGLGGERSPGRSAVRSRLRHVDVRSPSHRVAI